MEQENCLNCKYSSHKCETYESPCGWYFYCEYYEEMFGHIGACEHYQKRSSNKQ